MKTLPVSNSQKFALVDDEDFEKFSGLCLTFHKNSVSQNIKIGTKWTRVGIHRVIMGAKKGESLDHVNHDGFDNRKENLRICSHAENLRNQLTQKRSKHSRFKGVTWCSYRGRWKAQIRFRKINRHLGAFDTEEEAASAYNKSAEDLFGEFALLNKL